MFVCVRQALIETIESETLRNVLREFAQHIFDDGGQNEESSDHVFRLCNKKRFPDYNHWYKLIDDKIQESNLPKPVLFTWLTPKQRNEAIADLIKHHIPDIKEIDEPKDCDYSSMEYLEVPTQSLQSFVSAEPFTGSNIISKRSGSKTKKTSRCSRSCSARYYTCSDQSIPLKQLKLS